MIHSDKLFRFEILFILLSQMSLNADQTSISLHSLHQVNMLNKFSCLGFSLGNQLDTPLG